MDTIIYWFSSLARASKRSVSHFLVRHLSSSLPISGVEVTRHSSLAFRTFMRYMLVCGKWVKDPQISCGTLKLTSAVDWESTGAASLNRVLRSAADELWCFGGLSFAYRKNNTMVMVSRAVFSAIESVDDDHFDILQDMKENWGLFLALDSGAPTSDEEAPLIAKVILSA